MERLLPTDTRMPGLPAAVAAAAVASSPPLSGRACCVYMPSFVEPRHAHVLSNGVCSFVWSLLLCCAAVQSGGNPCSSNSMLDYSSMIIIISVVVVVVVAVRCCRCRWEPVGGWRTQSSAKQNSSRVMLSRFLSSTCCYARLYLDGLS
jgi:hypothetical protein